MTCVAQRRTLIISSCWSSEPSLVANVASGSGDIVNDVGTGSGAGVSMEGIMAVYMQGVAGDGRRGEREEGVYESLERLLVPCEARHFPADGSARRPRFRVGTSPRGYISYVTSRVCASSPAARPWSAPERTAAHSSARKSRVYAPTPPPAVPRSHSRRWWYRSARRRSRGRAEGGENGMELGSEEGEVDSRAETQGDTGDGEGRVRMGGCCVTRGVRLYYGEFCLALRCVTEC